MHQNFVKELQRFAHELKADGTTERDGDIGAIPVSNRTVLSQLATRQDIVREAVRCSREWIESVLQVTIEQTVMLDLDLHLSDLAARWVLPGQQTTVAGNRLIKNLASGVKSVEVPPNFAPWFSLNRRRNQDSAFGNNSRVWSGQWTDGPFALHLVDLDQPLVIMHTPFLSGGRASAAESQETIITSRNNASQFLALLNKLDSQQRSPLLFIGAQDQQPVSPCTWDDLVLDSNINDLVCSDFESFFEREAWFRAHRLPFRRGYLLYGPPGNGKSSCIKAMMHSRKLDAYSIRLCSEYADDDDLYALFATAAEAAPSMVVLEDLDRAFPRHTQSKSKVSLQQLLNSLDGLGTQDGVVVVATANDPTMLDPAILRRPGRFDRVVCFPVPSPDLRLAFLRKLDPHLTETALRRAVTESEGFSFAQLREAYILAGQYAFDTGGDIGQLELLAGVSGIRATMRISAPGRKLGFGARVEDWVGCSRENDKQGVSHTNQQQRDDMEDR